ncbi:hypothetical protein PHLGIDRAFT_406193 [Phlebiopsis gigantea 11061_1 CR5-6]|uniref:Aminoglycoside phosphotransferase domain-containing protein n=1 Tax=Phlebiopsis gigantea (strain 11061_1 CR5-6) TaxID=745531 RepID=A0A0C3NRK2_PHLG1|nr:hypothetical protein PHLGIDRAFT_406193 [Phlebiopsis gigantea 11061_1 CR5-6]
MSRSSPPPIFEVTSTTRLASLWSNYGHIDRLHLAAAPHTLILKSVRPPAVAHPDESHVRKLLSYAVERWFYRTLAARLPPAVKTAQAYPPPRDADHSLLLEDLATAYAHPASGSLARDAARCVLRWLAGFHGAFYRIHTRGGVLPLVPPPLEWQEGAADEGVWRRGTYWYLDTRREELAQTEEAEYGWLLPWVEQVNDAVGREIEQYGTLVHGDVKGANIVFSRDPYPWRGNKATPAIDEPLRCALYDLQYVGLGLSTYDLVYFLGTSVESKLLKSIDDEKVLLQDYFEALTAVTADNQTSPSEYTFDTFWMHWELAIVDWYRFMAGWGFWGNDRWVQRRAKGIVKSWTQSGFPL